MIHAYALYRRSRSHQDLSIEEQREAVRAWAAYSHKLSQVVQRGLRAHAARGQWAGGRPPYGYRRAIKSPDGIVRQLAIGEWKAKGQTVTLTIDLCEADVVREQIYGAYLRGHGLSSIATTLNAAGIPAPVSDRRIGTIAWTKGTIWAILRNPIYKGTLVYAKARYSEIGQKRAR
jgi:DNA invertase Pin-like site-specific DNA recombinase